MLKRLGSGAAAAALLAGTAFANPYEPYQDTTLVVMFPAHPHYDAAIEVLDQFTEQTGIEVEVDQLQYLRMRERQTLELTKDEGDYDLISFVVFSKADYVYADQLENLAKYFMNPALADPTYDQGDLIDGYVQNIGVAGGTKGYLPGQLGSAFGVPFGSETSVLAYRRDIFEKHGIEAPETYEELLDIACRIPELEPGMGGMASRAASGHQASHAFLLHLAPLGGQVFDDNWEPIINNEAGVEAANALKTIVDCGPEGGTTFGPSEAAAAFKSGQAAMFLDSIAFAAGFEDPSESQVAGNVGYALHPMGVERASQTGGFGLAIPANAPNKEAAFLLLQWLTSKEGDKAVAMAGGNPSRFSTYADPEVQAKYPYSETFGEALKYADPDWRPIIPVWGQINSDIGTTMSQVLTEGLDPQEALDGVAERTRALMEESGYYTWQAAE
ncbi:extracellular solute-binding protein [Jannaschia aquimarina]|uniref:Putative ABC transporter-binding protein n=1 Tax=Jannaschia aquimarina TaxID=935700 RepID=A0A0D1CJI0_9RHOB|nr:extracellular solute-binding protein [Jannaschia aquimarina]KIT14842.1 putative ABC transporter-binding protein precursor [Jannaschia aquimarina]SNS57350.1 carbohydrate ABC transporter substrate-binding protein, CUT1 family [Jannaschia aquimarina]